MTNQVQPPKLLYAEPDSLRESIKGASERLVKLGEQTKETMERYAGGFWEQPPRERFAYYVDVDLNKGGVLVWLMAIELVDAVEASKLAQDYRRLRREYGRV